MVAVKAADVDRAVATRRPEIAVLLFFGPDSGRVAERARAAAESAVDDPHDSFALIRMDGDALADSPTRLVEEATTFGMFGGRRAIWVRPTARNITAAIAPLLEVALVDTLVVVEAGDLSKAAPLRALCERSSRALALPSFADDARDIGAVIDETLRANDLTIDGAARQILQDSLGGDRMTTRGELAKLALYLHGRGVVTVEDVEACVSDVSAVAVDSVIDAAFAGQTAQLDDGLAHLALNGTAPAQILALALRHALQLLAVAEAIASGEDRDSALRGWRGLHFRRRDPVGRQIRIWTTNSLLVTIEALQGAVLETRRSPNLAVTLVSRVLFGVADRARRARR